ncbi:MAG: hypothetical protein U0Y68_23550 [Blastocatellia bacterium]
MPGQHKDIFLRRMRFQRRLQKMPQQAVVRGTFHNFRLGFLFPRNAQLKDFAQLLQACRRATVVIEDKAPRFHFRRPGIKEGNRFHARRKRDLVHFGQRPDAFSGQRVIARHIHHHRPLVGRFGGFLFSHRSFLLCLAEIKWLILVCE